VVLVVAFANIFTVIQPVMDSGDWNSTLWMVGGPIFFSLLALGIYENSNATTNTTIVVASSVLMRLLNITNGRSSSAWALKDWNSTLWMVGGPIFFSLLALGIYENYRQRTAVQVIGERYHQYHYRRRQQRTYAAFEHHKWTIELGLGLVGGPIFFSLLALGIYENYRQRTAVQVALAEG
jgi:hypothetical protein